MKTKEEIKATNLKGRQKNRDIINAKQRDYYQRNKTKMQKLHREAMQEKRQEVRFPSYLPPKPQGRTTKEGKEILKEQGYNL